MQLHESPLLEKSLLNARVTGGASPKVWTVGREVVLRLRDEALLLRQGEQIATLEPAANSRSLELLAQNQDALWLLARVKPGQVWLRCLAPMQRYNPESGLALGVDQRVADHLHQSKLIARADVVDAINWLSDEFLCPVEGGAPVRAFMTHHARLDRQQMQLIGRDYVVDLQSNAGQALLVERVTRRRQAEHLAFVLLEGDVQFVDVRQGLQPQDEAQRAALDVKCQQVVA